jgi:hypothetical protein
MTHPGNHDGPVPDLGNVLVLVLALLLVIALAQRTGR